MLTERLNTTRTAPSAAMHRGHVVGRGDGGAFVVRAAGDGTATLCELLDIGHGTPAVAIGDEVVYVLPAETPGRGCVVGVVRPVQPAQVVTEVTRLHGKRISIEADEDLVLKTGRASMIIRSNGDVEILGARFVARARAVIKLLAPMLRLN
jgi:hypothetical protein